MLVKFSPATRLLFLLFDAAARLRRRVRTAMRRPIQHWLGIGF